MNIFCSIVIRNLTVLKDNQPKKYCNLLQFMKFKNTESPLIIFNSLITIFF